MAKETGPKRILITGGSSGIGLALAARLSTRHHVLVTGRRLSEELTALIGERPSLDFVAADQAEPLGAVAHIAEALAARDWRGLDHAVLNAGLGFVTPPERETAAMIRLTLAVNLTANIALAHRLFPLLERAGGKLTLIGSTARRGAPRFASYAASKAALHGFFRAIGEEWRGRVAVQILHPGPTATAMHRRAGLPDGPMRRFFLPAGEMAAMIEKSMAGRRRATRLSYLEYLAGASLFGRGL